jgi:excisionase family DNA binding protein
MNLDKQWLTLKDISAELGIPLKTVYYYHESGEGPIAYKFGKHIRIKKEDFDSWVLSLGESKIKAVNPKVLEKKIKKSTATTSHPSKGEN